MISMPSQEKSAPLAAWQILLRGVPRAYAVLFFSPDSRLGWALLGISLLAPDVGLSGLAGVVAAGVLALTLGFDRERVRNGYLLFNPLLVCLTVGWMNRSYAFPFHTFLVLWIAAVLAAFFIAIALQKWVAEQFGLSPQSIPATLAAYLLYFLALAIEGPWTATHSVAGDWLNGPALPAALRSLFETFGSMIFEPHVIPGILVFAVLAYLSPLSTLVGSASFAVGMGTMSLLGFSPTPESTLWCGFNFLLAGIALGTSYFAPSRASLLLALASAFLCALVALAVASALRYFGLPASALPYNLVVLTLVYGLRQRTSATGLYPSPAPGMLPETAGRFVVLNARRFSHFALPALSLPFKGECMITQGMNGRLTHHAPWNWALDFEVTQGGQRWSGSGSQMKDYYSFDRIILAPCDGTIAAVVSDVPDNALGANNLEQNWGNYIVLYHDSGYYVLLAHLRQNSALVAVGQRVECSQPIARCGNSGRSPLPHLHMHVQNTPYPGAATRPFCLQHYAEVQPLTSRLSYHTSGQPAEEVRLTWPAPLPALRSFFCNWIPGEYRYRITPENRPAWEETIVLDFDETGRYRFVSRRYRARLTALVANQALYAIDYDGPGESILALLAVGVARVPCVADPDCEWDDFASATPFRPRMLRRLHEIVDPFLAPGLLQYRYHLSANEHGFDVHARLQSPSSKGLPGHAIRFVKTSMAPHLGIERIEARLCNGKLMEATLIAPAPSSQEKTFTGSVMANPIHAGRP